MVKEKRNQITIYPSDEVMTKLSKEAMNDKRALNNLVLYIIDKYYEAKK